MQYSPEINAHFTHPQGVGELAPADDVVTARVGNVASGSVIEWFLRYQGTLPNWQIITACYRVYGDVVMIATCSWIATWLPHKTRADCLSLSAEQVIDALQVPPLKKYAVLAVLKALRATYEQLE